ncbi:hypothetical protein F2Q69_00063418 [Brassica cretica]|uniref:Uncharacterized protein n=1 Tax=Brassica cretica TaxID=69181 RepID=A0A8S9REZ8_BRACR|nr:hypothetical protein F2Q69_00063418 [Brassica cretica]
MGEEAREWNRGTNLSLDMNKFPRDLLRGFMSENVDGRDETSDCDEESAVELNLGLSLGGGRAGELLGGFSENDVVTGGDGGGMEEEERDAVA